MANKLRDIFSEKQTLMTGTVGFIDKEAETRFADALKEVFQKGKTVQVDGVHSVSMAIESGAQQFPFRQVKGNISHFVVGPSFERKDYPLEINGENVLLPLWFYRTEEGMIIRTATEEIIYLQLTVNFVENRTNVEITPHYDKARNIIEIISSLERIERFLEKFFAAESVIASHEYASIMKHIRQTRFIYEMAQYAEETCGLRFEIRNIDLNENSSILDLYELNLVLKKRIPIRMSAKLTATESTSIELRSNYREEIGHEILLTYHGVMEYKVWGEKIRLHSSNLLCNAVIKDIVALDNGHTKVLYGDTEDKPMYVSYKAFKTEADAKQELECLVDHKEEYIEAKMAAQYWKDEVAKNY